MKAMLLAAGRGERLRPHTDITPKPLLEAHGLPLICHHVESLKSAGINEFVVNVSWLGEQIQQRLGDGVSMDVSIEYSVEPEALETAGGIVQALPLLGEQFIVVNADIFTDYDFNRLLEISSDAHLVLVPNPEHNVEGDFALNGDRVSNQGSPGYTFSGISIYRRSFFTGLPAGKRPLAPLLRKAADQKLLSGEIHRGDWTDVGTIERWQAIQ